MKGTYSAAHGVLSAVTNPGDHADVGGAAQFGPVGTEEVHRSLPIPSDGIVRWLIDQGISDAAMTSPWPVKQARVTFVGADTFDFDDSGEPAPIFRAADHGETIDLVAWQVRSGRLASWRGVAFAIGDVAEIWNPASWFMDSALRVHRSPLEWLRANRDGICIVQPRFTYAYLRHVPRLSFGDRLYAQQVKQWLQPPKSKPELLIEVAEELAA
jgi:hypothetical protein